MTRPVAFTPVRSMRLSRFLFRASRFRGIRFSVPGLAFALILPLAAHAEQARRDPAIMIEEADEFRAGLEAQSKGDPPAAARSRKALRPDLTGLDRPRAPHEFRRIWHHLPVCQGLTGECWAFASASFLETEGFRLTDRQMRLSESWIVYWEYVEKVRRFVRRRGASAFPRGSEPNAAFRIAQTHGLVPANAYPGQPAGRSFRDDRHLYAELRAHLNTLKERDAWDEPPALAVVRDILDRHMGPPPETVEHAGSRLSPKEYARQALGFDPDGYVSLMSFMAEPGHAWTRLDVPDNWWASRAYYNVPVDTFIRALREAVRGGVSVALVTDTSEPGFYFREDVAVVPTFDIPSAFIDDAARQMRFSNESTTDDHAVHIVGHQQRGGRHWYLVKDSDTRPRNGRHDGYMFYDEDYIKLKGLAIVLPRDVAERAIGRPLGPMPPDAE